MKLFAFFMLCVGCFVAQLDMPSDSTHETSVQGWVMAIVMAFLSGLAGVYKEVVIRKHPSRDIKVHTFWFSLFGMVYNLIAFCNTDLDNAIFVGFFQGYSFNTICLIFAQTLSGVAVITVLKYADNIVKVYSTSVVMLLTTIGSSMFLVGFDLKVSFFAGLVLVLMSAIIHKLWNSSTRSLNHSEQGEMELSL
ncbi:CMP-sialic acid transporter 4 [Platanthera zijinensis]|uniref:CMP-sialic acid transporter 4 n=1 Tax=Platanthera zijinensis TaxID=2320716 RepID=A0AAP0AUJ6_9ASPA